LDVYPGPFSFSKLSLLAPRFCSDLKKANLDGSIASHQRISTPSN
jgi:hypothetical protein